MAKEKTELTAEELATLQRVLYNSRWSGEDWNNTVNPLLDKLGEMIKELKDDQEDK